MPERVLQTRLLRTRCSSLGIWASLGRWVSLVAWDASNSVEHLVLSSLVCRTRSGIAEVDHASNKAYVNSLVWCGTSKSFCIRDIAQAVCCRRDQFRHV